MLIQKRPLLIIRFYVLHAISILKKQALLSKLINADYLSPFNLAVSADGKDLYVVAQEGNALLIVDS